MLRRIYSVKSIEKLLHNCTDIAKGIMIAGGVGILGKTDSFSREEGLYFTLIGVIVMLVISLLDTIYVNPKSKKEDKQ